MSFTLKSDPVTGEKLLTSGDPMKEVIHELISSPVTANEWDIELCEKIQKRKKRTAR